MGYPELSTCASQLPSNGAVHGENSSFRSHPLDVISVQTRGAVRVSTLRPFIASHATEILPTVTTRSKATNGPGSVGTVVARRGFLHTQ